MRVDEGNAVGNRLRPGNFVDVFFTLKRDGNAGMGGEIDRTQARLLMSKVRVLAFGNATTTGDTGGDPNGMVRTAVLAVPVADVDRLTLAESAGRLDLRVAQSEGCRSCRSERAAGFAGRAEDGGARGRARHAAGLDARRSRRRARHLVGQHRRNRRGGRRACRRCRRCAMPATRVAANTNSTNGGIEVIRGGRAETVAR